MDLTIAFTLARFSSDSRFGPSRPVSVGDLAAFRLLVGIALSSLSRTAPPQQRIHSPPMGPFAYAKTWVDLDLMMNRYEDPDLLDLALSHIPIQDLYVAADQVQASDARLPCYEDALAEALVKWFKPNFFEWVDPIKCSKCGEKTEMKHIRGPITDDERAGGAGRVEEHACPKQGCGGMELFPRYNDLRALMKSRKGRCGEFANMFTLMIRAGLRARYVWCAEDHVWNEYFSPGLNRWVHMDSCENARDQHHLYSKGWGKKMSYVIAFSVDGGPMDVTHAYIPPEEWDGLKGEDISQMRTKAGTEAQAEDELIQIRGRRRADIPGDEKKRLGAEDERDRTWWTALDLLDESTATLKISEDELAGRKSGTDDWKQTRGESGQ